MWHFTNNIPNERALCEFVKIKYHQADSDNHWTKTHGDECKVKEPEPDGQLGAEPEKGLNTQPDRPGGGFGGNLQGLLPPGLAPLDPSNPNQPNLQHHGHHNQPHGHHHGQNQQNFQQHAPQQHNQPLDFNHHGQNQQNFQQSHQHRTTKQVGVS